MAEYDFQCLLCGSQFDGVLRAKCSVCPMCGALEKHIVDAETAEEQEAENRAINAHNEELEDGRSYNP